MGIIIKCLKGVFSFFNAGNRVKPNKYVSKVIMVFSVTLSLFAIWLGVLGALHPYIIGLIFLPMIYFIAFTTVSSYHTLYKIIWMDYVFAISSLACGIYFYANSDRYLNWMVGFSTFEFWDYVFSLIFVLLTLEVMRRCIGFGLSIVVYSLMAYTFFGHYFSGTFSVHQIDTTRFLQIMTIGLDGIFGKPTQVAITYAFLFVIFGKLYEISGGGQFFFDFAASLTGKKPGGPAKVAVISSGLFGMISGSPVADVMTTGSVTIPIMKKVGYPAKFAAAVEAAAATGGAILPPVMGATVFMMVAFTGIPYVKIATSAIFIALLYYFAIYMQVHYVAIKQGLKPLAADQIPGLLATFRKGWINILPFAALVYWIFIGYTPAYAASLSIFVIIVTSWLGRKYRITFKKLVEGFVSTCVSIAPLVAAVAAAGIVVGCLLLTGLAGKVSSLVHVIAGGNLLLTALLAVMVTIVLGMGMPVISVYVLVASMLAPELIDLGVPVLSAHLFLIYYASMSAITPPVAVACFAAASIAEANPMQVALRTVRLAFVAFIIPFFFLFEPALLLQGEVWYIVLRMVLSVIGVFLLVIAFAGYMRNELSMKQRLLAGIAGILFIIPVLWVDILAIALAALFWMWTRKYNYKIADSKIIQ
jgi:TRAP transporter 4TM/12TM fusion protein